MKLTEPTPAVMRDAGTQGPCSNAGGRVRRKKAGRRRLTAGAAEQTEKRTAAVSTQHPPAAPRPFLVFNDCTVGEGGKLVKIRGKWIDGHDFFTDLLLSDTPSAGQVREAVADHLAVSPTAVELWRGIGRRLRDDETVFLVGDDPGDWYGFADISGTRSSEREVNWNRKELEDPFPLIPGLNSFIYILHR